MRCSPSAMRFPEEVHLGDAGHARRRPHGAVRLAQHVGGGESVHARHLDRQWPGAPGWADRTRSSRPTWARSPPREVAAQRPAQAEGRRGSGRHPLHAGGISSPRAASCRPSRAAARASPSACTSMRPSAVERPSFGLKLNTEMGTLITDTSTWLHGLDIPLVAAGDGYLDLEVDLLEPPPRAATRCHCGSTRPSSTTSTTSSSTP